MSDTDNVKQQSLGEKLQSLPKGILYLILFVVASVPLFFPIALPNKPVEMSIDFYANLMSLKPGDKVLIGSDWTNSTRGESGGEMEALLRILIRRGVKFAVYTTADVQAPQVARITIARIAKDEAAHGAPLYQPFQDYVVTGFFPNSEGTTLAVNTDVRQAFAGRKDYPPSGQPTDVMQSPVFSGVNSVSDFKYLILITASGTEKVTLQRVKKTPLMFMVTGVMVPEDTTYYASGQLKGLCGGVKGVFDLETMMDHGVNTGQPDTVDSPGRAPIPGFAGKPNAGRGTAYYFALHCCLALLILAILVGNVGMVMAKRKAA